MLDLRWFALWIFRFHVLHRNPHGASRVCLAAGAWLGARLSLKHGAPLVQALLIVVVVASAADLTWRLRRQTAAPQAAMRVAGIDIMRCA